MNKSVAVLATAITIHLFSGAIAEDKPSLVKAILRESKQIAVEVTAYSSTVDQTDSTPFITASGQRVRSGIVAVSQDLLKEVPFGAKITVCAPECQVYEVQDTMHRRIQQTVDIWMVSRGDALQFGRKRGTLTYTPVER